MYQNEYDQRQRQGESSYIQDELRRDLSKIRAEQGHIRQQAYSFEQPTTTVGSRGNSRPVYSFEEPKIATSPSVVENPLGDELQAIQQMYNEYQQKVDAIKEAEARRAAAEAERLEAQKRCDLEMAQLVQTKEQLSALREQWSKNIDGLNATYFQIDQSAAAAQQDAQLYAQQAESIRKERESGSIVLEELKRSIGGFNPTDSSEIPPRNR